MGSSSRRAALQDSKKNSANIKLPKISLPKFTGPSPIECVSFWDQFTVAVDENQSFHDVQKLAYLKWCLLGPTAKSIRGYTLTEDNYGSWKF